MNTLCKLSLAAIIVFGTSVAASAQTPPATQPAQGNTARTITIDAYWLRLKPSQLKPGQSIVPASLLSDNEALFAHARVIGFEGQEVVTDIVHALSVVTGVTPVVAPGVSLYQPTLSSEPVSVRFVESSTQFNDQTLTVEFDSMVSMVQKSTRPADTTQPTTQSVLQDNPLGLDAAGTAAMSTAVLHAKSTVIIPVGVPTIVSGVSDKPGEADNRTLCLVLYATVVNVR
jgi:hypothetical protein